MECQGVSPAPFLDWLMLLAIDIGNSSIKFGIYEAEGLLHKFSVATWPDYAPEELFFDRFQYVEQKFVRIDKVIVSSVVPEVNETLVEASRELFKVTPTFVDHETDLGIKILYDPPSSVGPDRLAGAFCAVEKHGAPVVICSLGTATVIDAVDEERQYVGGIIAPGVLLMAASLHDRTSLLPKVKLRRPQGLIGRNTEEAILSGVVNGTASMVGSLVRRVASEIAGDKTPTVIVSGGFVKTIGPDLPKEFIHEENLILEGLRKIAARQ
ncbi:MAG TPA: type III pantothenate kinase [Pyrinomonadaceae bacterium]|nr:type III pantothenate kinase [Pyrinomonadaceae bacterium]HMP65280.1 type III pantothenate kinase [Pyrinomonadaceae bacterium]